VKKHHYSALYHAWSSSPVLIIDEEAPDDVVFLASADL